MNCASRAGIALPESKGGLFGRISMPLLTWSLWSLSMVTSLTSLLYLFRNSRLEWVGEARILILGAKSVGFWFARRISASSVSG